jgi:hypothetical protein
LDAVSSDPEPEDNVMKNWTLKLAMLAVMGLATAAQACPMCKDSVPNSDSQSASGVPVGLNTSVYMMLGGLFATLGLVSFVIVKGVRETDARSSRRGFPLE